MLPRPTSRELPVLRCSRISQYANGLLEYRSLLRDCGHTQVFQQRVKRVGTESIDIAHGFWEVWSLLVAEKRVEGREVLVCRAEQLAVLKTGLVVAMALRISCSQRTGPG